jgi:hypothetical protein
MKPAVKSNSQNLCWTAFVAPTLLAQSICADSLTRYSPACSRGVTSALGRLSRTRRSMAARISSFCQGAKTLGPTKTAQVSDSPKDFSMSGCHGLPGIGCHLSSQAWMPSFASRRANSSTARFIGIAMRKKDVGRASSRISFGDTFGIIWPNSFGDIWHTCALIASVLLGRAPFAELRYAK